LLDAGPAMSASGTSAVAGGCGAAMGAAHEASSKSVAIHAVRAAERVQFSIQPSRFDMRIHCATYDAASELHFHAGAPPNGRAGSVDATSAATKGEVLSKMRVCSPTE